MDEFFMYDEKMEQRVDQLKRMLRLSMNGVVSGCMSASGLDYKLNYGVQLPRLKEMAVGMDMDKMFAQRLWMSNCREMMLLATMLFPVDSFDEETALKWVSECHNMELVEQLSLNLLRNMRCADGLIIRLLDKQGKYEKATAYVLASFLYLRGSLSVETEEACKSTMENDASSSDYAVYSSVARFLRVLSGNERTFVAQFMDRLDGKSEKGPSFVRENVRMMLM